MPGYTQISNDILDDLALSAHAKLVWICLARFNPSFPSRARIAAMAGISVASAKRAFKELVSVGYLRVEYRTGQSSVYVLGGGSHRPEGGFTVSRGGGSHRTPNKTKGIKLNNKSANAPKKGEVEWTTPPDGLLDRFKRNKA